MTGEPLFRVVTAYTLSQYREYNRTVQRSNGVYLGVAGAFLIYLAMGALMAVLLSAWYAVPVFAAIGLFSVYLNVRNLRKAETAQYQQEQLIGSITYEFYDDRVDMTTYAGTASYPYGSIPKVMENSTAFYIMTAKTSGAILPKEDCSADLEAFIRSRFAVTIVRDALSHRNF